MSSQISQLVFQYCFFQLLSDQGIKARKFIGDGVGEITVSVITGKMTFSQAIERIASLKDTEGAETLTKCEKIMTNFRGTHVVLAEVGLQGSISATLTKLRQPQDTLNIVFLHAGKETGILHYIMDLYLLGCEIDWAAYYNNSLATKVSLPTYPFERTRCWFHPPVKSYLQDWFYEVLWRRQVLDGSSDVPNGKTYMIIADRQSLAIQVAAKITLAGSTCIIVHYGKSFFHTGNTFEVGSNQSADFDKLVATLQRNNIYLDGIIDLSHCVKDEPVPGALKAAEALTTQFSLLKSLSPYFASKGFVLALAGYHLNPVTPSERYINVIGNAAIGFLKGVVAEYPMLAITAVDLDTSVSDQFNVACILNEVFSDELIRFTAYRGGERFIPSLNRSAVTDFYEPKEKAVYLVTGGTGGIGVEICRSLARKKKSVFILVAKTAIPNRREWDAISDDSAHELHHKVKFLLELEAMESVIEYHSLDVSREADVSSLFESLATRFKKVEGIIHLAGEAIFDQNLACKEISAVENTFAPKIQGSLLLLKYASLMNPEFFVMFSSLNAIFPKKHSLDYAAANAFQDALATRLSIDGQRIISINWPGWYQVNTNGETPSAEKFNDHVLKPISIEDGIELFYYALASHRSNCIIADIATSKFRPAPFLHFGDDALQVITPSEKEQRNEAIAVAQRGSIIEPLDVKSKILAIWKDVLKSPEIGMDDDFFEIGGHSLNGAQIINRIETEFNISLSIDDLLDHATINQLALYIDTNTADHDIPEVSSDIIAIEEQEYYELSPAQSGFWVHNQLREGTAAYVMNSIYEVEGDLNMESLLKAFQTLVERHESLRTIFISVEGLPKQRIIPPGNYRAAIRFEDLRAKTNPNTKLVHLALDTKLYFDLSTPPCQIKIQQLSEHRFLFSLAVHHISSDGWSLRTFFSELMALYGANQSGTNLNYPPLTVQYKDYAAWVNEKVRTGALTSQREYWLKKLQGTLPQFTLLPDQGGTGEKSYRSAKVNFSLTPLQAEKLQSMAKNEGVTLFMSVLAVWKVVFYKYSHQEDSIISTTIFGRSHQALEPLLGNFLNTLILRDVIAGDESFSSFLHKVKETTLGAYANQLYPFDQLIDELPVRRGPAMNSLFNVGIVWHNYNEKAENVSGQIHGLTFKPVEKEGDGLIFDILINGSEQLTDFSIEYNIDRFFSHTIDKLMLNFSVVGELIANDPTRTIDGIINESLTSDEKMKRASLNKDSLNVLSDDFAFLEKPV